MARIPGQSSHTMWGKSRDKKAARMYHTRNFTTGHVEPNEYYLSQVGLRGRKRWIFFSVVVCIYLLVIGHFLLTCMILGVLRFDSTGPPYFNFKEDGSLVWPEGAELTDIRVNSLVHAYHNHSLTINGQVKEQVVFQAGNPRRSTAGNNLLNSSQVVLSPTEVRVHPYKSFSISHSGHQLLFINSSVATMTGVKHLEQLNAGSSLRTTNVQAPQQTVLKIQSPTGALNVHGVDGVYLGGKEVNITGAFDMNLSSQSSIHIAGEQGVRFLGLPSTSPASRHHLCACSNGRLFLVPSNARRCAGAEGFESICNS